MQPYTQLNTPLAIKLFKFIQPHLIDFKPGQIRPSNNSQSKNNSNINENGESKYTFKYLLRSLAGQRPDFLTKFIYEANPEINTNIKIPFNILYNTLLSLIGSFTETLFTKLNYKQIFCSHSNIPPYTISNRNHITLNFARLHLFLNHTYKTINNLQFIKDLGITPIRMKLHYNFHEDQLDKPLLTIKSDHKFNIYIDLNIPKENFLNTYKTPSLNECNHSFENWYNSFFNSYSRQFVLIDKPKTMNYIKYQIYLQLTSYLKKLLPLQFAFEKPNSLQERSKQTTKATLYHFHMCSFSTTKLCPLITAEQTHDFSTISNIVFKQSFKHFPAPKEAMDIDDDNNKPKPTQPNLDFTIFQIGQLNQASFNTPTPIPLLNELATKAEQEYISLNQSELNHKRRTYFFYCYFKAFLQAAAQNDEIADLNQHDAIKKIAQNSTDIHFLARIITYYNISHQTHISLPQIRSKYKTTFYPQAQQLIFDIQKISFKQPKDINHTLFFKLQTSQSKAPLTETEDNLTDNTIPSTPNSPKTSYADITSQNF
jgi:hypothetical protein